MKKELRPFHDHVECAVCGRTMLKGERADPFVTDAGERHMVCALCSVRAEHAGWIRESDQERLPSRGSRSPERRGLFGRRKRRFEPSAQEPATAEPEAAPPSAEESEPAPAEHLAEPVVQEDPPIEEPPPRPEPRRRRDTTQGPRHVRAVPTTVEARVERALELFNRTDHQRTVTGLTRSLGAPWVAAMPDPSVPSTVTVLVAWELSWYRYRVDLGDNAQPVILLDKGDELEDIDEELREWNAELDPKGKLVIGVSSE